VDEGKWDVKRICCVGLFRDRRGDVRERAGFDLMCDDGGVGGMGPGCVEVSELLCGFGRGAIEVCIDELDYELGGVGVEWHLSYVSDDVFVSRWENSTYAGRIEGLN
jgi:hypothetical protein